MNSEALRWVVSVVAVVILAVGICARAQAPTPTHFSGLIDDYSPETILGKVVGPWEMHGKWSSPDDVFTVALARGSSSDVAFQSYGFGGRMNEAGTLIAPGGTEAFWMLQPIRCAGYSIHPTERCGGSRPRRLRTLPKPSTQLIKLKSPDPRTSPPRRGFPENVR